MFPCVLVKQDIEWTVDSFNITIPCIGLSYTLGELLRASPNSAVRLAVEADLTIARTFNVIAEVTGSDLVEEKVVVGAHLDSVEDGPGINDNGSGYVVAMYPIENGTPCDVLCVCVCVCVCVCNAHVCSYIHVTRSSCSF